MFYNSHSLEKQQEILENNVSFKNVQAARQQKTPEGILLTLHKKFITSVKPRAFSDLSELNLELCKTLLCAAFSLGS